MPSRLPASRTGRHGTGTGTETGERVVEQFALKRTGGADYPRFIKALVQGPPKSGKTSLLATFPNPIVADVEAASGGLQSIAHLDIPHITVDHSSKLDTLRTILKDDALRAKAAADVGRPSIDTVAIDTLDALQELLKKERLRSERRQTMQRDDWGWLLEQFQELIRSFTSLPMNVVFTVHTKTVQDDESRLVNMPALQGAIQDQIAGMVGYSLLSARTVEIDQATGQKYSNYTLQTEGDERNPHLGNRAAGRLPRVIRPDFQDIYDAAFGNLPEMPERDSVTVETTKATEATEAPAEVTQGSGQATEPTPEPEAPKPDGAPRDDSVDPINAAALQHLTKMTGEFGVDLHPDVKGWSLGQARDVARFVVACKTDAANGDSDQDELRETVLEGLVGMGAVSATPAGEVVPSGTIDEVVTWAQGSQERAQVALAHEEGKGDDARKGLVTKLAKLAEKSDAEQDSGQASEQPEASPAPESEPEVEASEEPAEEVLPEPPAAMLEEQEERPEPPTPEQAAELIKSELGGMELTGKDIPEEQRPCDECGKSKTSAPDDFDIDIARLSEVRFKKWLCVNDYMALVQQKKAAS